MPDDEYQRTAWQYGKASALANADGHAFNFLWILVPGITGAVGAYVATDPVMGVLLIALGVTAGYLAVPLGWAAVAAIAAPTRQRNAARDALHELKEDQAEELEATVELSGQRGHSRLTFGPEATDHDDWLVTFKDVRITNHSAATMNLDIWIIVPLEFNDAETGEVIHAQMAHREGEWRRGFSFHTDNINFHGPFLETPLTLESERTVVGTLGFSDVLRGGNDVELPRGCKIRVLDYLTSRELFVDIDPVFLGSPEEAQAE